MPCCNVTRCLLCLKEFKKHLAQVTVIIVMEKSIKNRITTVMECEQLSRFAAQEESQYVLVHRMTGTDSTNFHGSL